MPEPSATEALLGYLRFLEFLWCALSFVGVSFGIIHFTTAINELRWLRKSLQNGLLRLQARGNMSRERDRLFIQALGMLLGVVSVATPEPVRQSLTYESILVSTAFLLVQALSVWGSVRDWAIHEKVRRGYA